MEGPIIDQAQPPAREIPPGAIPGPRGGWLLPSKKGEVRNPTGHGGLWLETKQLCRKHGPAAAERLIEIALKSKDEKCAIVACKEILDRGFGKVKEQTDSDTTEQARKLDLKTVMAQCSDTELQVMKALFGRMAGAQQAADLAAAERAAAAEADQVAGFPSPLEEASRMARAIDEAGAMVIDVDADTEDGVILPPMVDD